MEAIANNPAAPTFANTIAEMEKTGLVLDRATNVFFNLQGTYKNDARDAIERDYAPKFSAHRDAIMLNPTLFARIKTLYDTRATLGLDPIDLRLLERRYDDFVRSGAALDDAQKTRIRAINTQLSTLNTQFDQNVLAEVNDSAVVVDSRDQLKGMSEEQIGAAAEAAKARGLEGKYVITLLNTTGQPAETQLEDRALRQRLHEASVARGSRGNKWDNTGIVSKVLKLRSERATLLGYDTYANYVLADETAKNQDNVNKMLRQLAPAAVANARREGADLQAMIDADQKAAGKPVVRTGRMGLVALLRKSPRGEVQLRRIPAQAVLRNEERAGERRVLCRDQVVRHHLQGTHRPAEVPPGHLDLRRHRQGRQAAFDLHLRSLCTFVQARWRLDEYLCVAIGADRPQPGRRQSPQHPQAGRRQADADDLG